MLTGILFILTNLSVKITKIPVKITEMSVISSKNVVKLKFQLTFWQDGKWQDSKPRVWITADAPWWTQGT